MFQPVSLCSQTPGVLWISSDGDDRMGEKIKTPKNPQGFQQNTKKSPGLPTKPQKIPGQTLTHAEFLSLKNFQLLRIK